MERMGTSPLFSHLEFCPPWILFYLPFGTVFPSVNPTVGIRDKKPAPSQSGMWMQTCQSHRAAASSLLEHGNGKEAWLGMLEGTIPEGGRGGLSPFPPTHSLTDPT